VKFIQIPGYVNEKFMFLVRDYHDDSNYRSSLDNLQASVSRFTLFVF